VSCFNWGGAQKYLSFVLMEEADEVSTANLFESGQWLRLNVYKTVTWTLKIISIKAVTKTAHSRLDKSAVCMKQ